MTHSGSSLQCPHTTTLHHVVNPLFTAHAFEAFLCSTRAVPAGFELVSGVAWTMVCCIRACVGGISLFKLMPQQKSKA